MAALNGTVDIDGFGSLNFKGNQVTDSSGNVLGTVSGNTITAADGNTFTWNGTSLNNDATGDSYGVSNVRAGTGSGSGSSGSSTSSPATTSSGVYNNSVDLGNGNTLNFNDQGGWSYNGLTGTREGNTLIDSNGNFVAMYDTATGTLKDGSGNHWAYNDEGVLSDNFNSVNYGGYDIEFDQYDMTLNIGDWSGTYDENGYIYDANGSLMGRYDTETGRIIGADGTEWGVNDNGIFDQLTQTGGKPYYSDVTPSEDSYISSFYEDPFFMNLLDSNPTLGEAANIDFDSAGLSDTIRAGIDAAIEKDRDQSIGQFQHQMANSNLYRSGLELAGEMDIYEAAETARAQAYADSAMDIADLQAKVATDQAQLDQDASFTNAEFYNNLASEERKIVQTAYEWGIEIKNQEQLQDFNTATLIVDAIFNDAKIQLGWAELEDNSAKWQTMADYMEEELGIEKDRLENEEDAVKGQNTAHYVDWFLDFLK